MRFIIVWSFIFLLSSCSTVKRYKTVEVASENNNLADINLFSSKIDVEKSNSITGTLWQLTGKGQEALINALDKKAKDTDDLMLFLEKVYKLEVPKQPKLQYTLKDLVLCFSISKERDYLSKNLSAADRLEYLNLTLNIHDSLPLKFVRWNRFITEYASIDIADVSFSSTFELSGAVGGKNASSKETKNGNDDAFDLVTLATELTPGLNANQTFSRNENQKIRYRYLALNGFLNSKKIHLEQEGMREIDLAGNIIVNISLEFESVPETVFIASKLKKGNQYNEIAKIEFLKSEALVPDLEKVDDIMAQLDFNFVYRNVKNKRGQKTFYEWDDKVRYFQGNSVDIIRLLGRRDVLPPFHYIGNDSTSAIRYKDVNNEEGKLTFKDYFEADKFLDWLINYSINTKDGNEIIKINGISLYFIDDSNKISGLTAEKMKGLIGSLYPIMRFK